MTSQVEVANDALTHLGKNRITSLDDSTVEARVMKQFFSRSVDAVLQDHPYHCAKYQAQLSQDASGPTFGYTYSYQLPTKPFCLRVLAVNNQGPDDTWQRKGRKIHTDLAICKIEYIGRTDVSLLDPLVNTAVASYLAFRAAYTLTKSRSLQNDMYQLYQQDKRMAMSADGVEGSTRRLKKSRIREARAQSNVTEWTGNTT